MMARAVPPMEPRRTAGLLSFGQSTVSMTGMTGAPIIVPQKSRSTSEDSIVEYHSKVLTIDEVHIDISCI